MVLKQIRLGRLVSQRREAEKNMKTMLEMIETIEKEKRSFTDEESKRYSSLEKQLESIDAEFEKEGLTMDEAVEQLEDIKTRSKQAEGSLTNTSEYRAMKRRTENPMEVRGYRRNERVGKYNTDVTIGDLIYSHITGKFRSEEVRASLSTTSGGLVIPQNVYSNFIDLLRDNSILGEVTTYEMDSKTLSIPRVVSDIVPEFKLENELITESSPVFDSVKLEAKPLYAMCPISLELVEGSNLDMGAVITDLMASAMGSAMQNFMLHGAVNGYEGVMNQMAWGITGDVNYANIGELVSVIRNNNGIPSSIVMNSRDATELELLTDTTGQYIQAPSFMNELRKHTLSNAMTTGNALLGDLSAIAFGVLSEGGLQIEVSRTAGEAFKRGQLLVRARLNGDFVVTNQNLLAKIEPTTP
jgi:HK97 family phage major capsid protein